MSAGEIGSLLRHPAAGDQIAACVQSFPYLQMEAQLHPITRTVLRIQLTITPAFTWKDRWAGGWWVGGRMRGRLAVGPVWDARRMPQQPQE
jgi:activating signal cointegrator complex subunit 3